MEGRQVGHGRMLGQLGGWGARSTAASAIPSSCRSSKGPVPVGWVLGDRAQQIPGVQERGQEAERVPGAGGPPAWLSTEAGCPPGTQTKPPTPGVLEQGPGLGSFRVHEPALILGAAPPLTPPSRCPRWWCSWTPARTPRTRCAHTGRGRRPSSSTLFSTSMRHRYPALHAPCVLPRGFTRPWSPPGRAW